MRAAAALADDGGARVGAQARRRCDKKAFTREPIDPG